MQEEQQEARRKTPLNPSSLKSANTSTATQVAEALTAKVCQEALEETVKLETIRLEAKRAVEDIIAKTNQKLSWHLRGVDILPTIEEEKKLFPPTIQITEEENEIQPAEPEAQAKKTKKRNKTLIKLNSNLLAILNFNHIHKNEKITKYLLKRKIQIETYKRNPDESSATAILEEDEKQLNSAWKKQNSKFIFVPVRKEKAKNIGLQQRAPMHFLGNTPHRPPRTRFQRLAPPIATGALSISSLAAGLVLALLLAKPTFGLSLLIFGVFLGTAGFTCAAAPRQDELDPHLASNPSPR